MIQAYTIPATSPLAPQRTDGSRATNFVGVGDVGTWGYFRLVSGPGFVAQPVPIATHSDIASITWPRAKGYCTFAAVYMAGGESVEVVTHLAPLEEKIMELLTSDRNKVILTDEQFAALQAAHPNWFRLIVPGVPQSGWVATVTAAEILAALETLSKADPQPQPQPKPQPQPQPKPQPQPEHSEFITVPVATELGWDTALQFWSSERPIDFEAVFYLDGVISGKLPLQAQVNKPILMMLHGDKKIRATLMRYPRISGLHVLALWTSPPGFRQSFIKVEQT